jgi:hypothetical protein
MEPEAFVREIYRLALGREADAAGLKGWAQAIRDSGDPTLVLRAILESEEYRQRNRPQSFDTNLRDKISSQLRDSTLTIVDVGAQKLESEDHIYAPLCSAGLRHRIIGFEPLADKMTERMAAESEQSLVMLPYAVGDNAEHTLFVNNEDATSSIFPLNQDFCSDFEHIHALRTVKTISVTTKELDDLLPDGAVPVDFLEVRHLGRGAYGLERCRATIESNGGYPLRGRVLTDLSRPTTVPRYPSVPKREGI